MANCNIHILLDQLSEETEPHLKFKKNEQWLCFSAGRVYFCQVGLFVLGSGKENSRLVIVLDPDLGIGWGSPWQQILVLAWEQWTSFFPLSRRLRGLSAFFMRLPPSGQLEQKDAFCLDIGWSCWWQGLSLTWQCLDFMHMEKKTGIKNHINIPSQERLNREYWECGVRLTVCLT